MCRCSALFCDDVVDMMCCRVVVGVVDGVLLCRCRVVVWLCLCYVGVVC